jgi:hypothetical protein
MKCTDIILNFRLLFLLVFWYCITADQTLSLNFIGGGSVSMGLVFMLMLGSKENSHHIFSSIKSTHMLTFMIKLIINTYTNFKFT